MDLTESDMVMALGEHRVYCVQFCDDEAHIGCTGGPPGPTSFSCKISVVSRCPHLGWSRVSISAPACAQVHLPVLRCTYLCSGALAKFVLVKFGVHETMG